MQMHLASRMVRHLRHQPDSKNAEHKILVSSLLSALPDTESDMQRLTRRDSSDDPSSTHSLLDYPDPFAEQS